MSEEDSPKAIRDRNQRIRDEAAQKRKTKSHSERRAAVSRNLAAGEMVDDALARGTHAVTGWLKRNFSTLQWVIVGVAAVGIGVQIYRSRTAKADAKVTDSLMAGVIAELGRVGTEESAMDPSTGLDDPRVHFADDTARLKAAEDAFRAAAGNPSVKTLAELALAGVLLDQGKHKEAVTAYDAVRASALATKDADVRSRAIEGSALAHEALGEKDAALKGFRELGNSENAGFAALGLYHQARLAFAGGDRDGAKALLKKVLDKVAKPSAESPPGFVAQASRELLSTIDPAALAAQNELSPEQLQALAQQAAQKQGADPQMTKEKLDELLRQVTNDAAPAPAPSGAPASTP